MTVDELGAVVTMLAGVSEELASAGEDGSLLC